MKKKLSSFATLTLVTAMATMAVYAAIIVDENGVGFVGKGDVQNAFGWNNAALQACVNFENGVGCLEFKYESTSTTVSEVSWVCTNSNNQNIQERERTTTTETSSGWVYTTVARVKNQATGFNLNGGTLANTSTSTSEGNQLNSCPSGPWNLTQAAGDPEIISTESDSDRTLTVRDRRDPDVWKVLQLD